MLDTPVDAASISALSAAMFSNHLLNNALHSAASLELAYIDTT
jgi:hypothetical protein